MSSYDIHAVSDNIRSAEFDSQLILDDAHLNAVQFIRDLNALAGFIIPMCD